VLHYVTAQQHCCWEGARSPLDKGSLGSRDGLDAVLRRIISLSGNRTIIFYFNSLALSQYILHSDINVLNYTVKIAHSRKLQ